jgi:hypothetical protein
VIVPVIGRVANARIVHAGDTALVEHLNAEGGSVDDLPEEPPTVVERYGLVAQLAGVSVEHIDVDARGIDDVWRLFERANVAANGSRTWRT